MLSKDLDPIVTALSLTGGLVPPTAAESLKQSGRITQAASLYLSLIEQGLAVGLLGIN